MFIFPGIFDSTKPKLEQEEAGEYYRNKNGKKSSDFSNQILEYFSLILPKKQDDEQVLRPINRANHPSYHQEAKDESVRPTSARGWYSVDGNQDQVGNAAFFRWLGVGVFPILDICKQRCPHSQIYSKAFLYCSLAWIRKAFLSLSFFMVLESVPFPFRSPFLPS